MRRRLSRVSQIVLAFLIAVTALATWATSSATGNQESKLLSERADEVRLVLSTATTSLNDQLDTIGGLLRKTHNSPAAFDRATEPTVTGGQHETSVAVLRKGAAGYQVVIANGAAIQTGQVISDQRTVAFDRAMTAGAMVPTQVLGAGPGRQLGFAIGPPATPPGVIVYQQVGLGMLGPPSAANTAPFSEVRIVLYDGTSANGSQAVVSTTNHLPLTGRIVSKHLTVGDSSWLLQVSAVHPLIGGITDAAPWFVLGAGIVLCGLLTMTVEIESRRRRNALALYRSEHTLAEGLQRSLLPELPTTEGLQIAASYLPGTEGLQVGGDWYDVFALGGDRFGIVIGDVVGHDISASATMSRAQAALRAYAVRDDNPASVLDRLDMLIESFQSERLVTIFYGVLGPAGPTGSRELWYSNAGHPAPISWRVGGPVTELDQASSTLLGVAPSAALIRPAARTELAPGSTLLLFTDGLVEVPGESLTDSIERLKLLAAEAGPVSPDTLVDRLTSALPDGQRRDDVAVIAIRLTGAADPQPAASDGSGTEGAGRGLPG